jgi:cellulose synthase/poly-beta-1,6-N-acetylglucosamine synthase-like glycosyltransferase
MRRVGGGGCARALRVGEIVLLVDSDTVVPEDCLRDAARELAESPEVAIIQLESGECVCGGAGSFVLLFG